MAFAVPPKYIIEPIFYERELSLLNPYLGMAYFLTIGTFVKQLLKDSLYYGYTEMSH